MMHERGLKVDHSTVFRCVQRYAPEINKRGSPHLKMSGTAYRVDETYIKVGKACKYLYRAVDKEGQTIEFMLSAKREMNVTSAQSKKIVAALEAYVSKPEPDLVNLGEPLNLRDVAAKLDVLPMYFDMGGCYGIRPSGEIVSFTWDEPCELRVEDNPRIWNAVLFQGAKEYPELGELIPTRPPDAIECPHCKGTGIIREFAEQGLALENIVCYCGGIGWLPSGGG